MLYSYNRCKTTTKAIWSHIRKSNSSDGMVTFAQAIHLGKMDKFTKDFEKLTGEKALTVQYMFEHTDDFQIGARHSKDN